MNDSEFDAAQGRFRRAALEQRRMTRSYGSAVDTLLFFRRRTTSGPNSRTPRLRVPRLHRPRVSPPTGRRIFQTRRIPSYIQSEASDCGPACLAMALAFHGAEFSPETLRAETNAGRDGTSARSLLDAARRYGVTGRGVRVGLEGLRLLPRASILHWNFNHFVVLDRVTRRHVYIADPAFGRRRLEFEDVSKAFTGLALEFQSSIEQRRKTSSAHDVNPWTNIRQFFPAAPAWFPLVGASLLLLVFSFVTPFASVYVIDHATTERSGGTLFGILFAALVLTAAFFGLQAARGFAITSIQTLADKRVTTGVLEHLFALPYDFFTRRSPGDLALRVRTSTAVRQVLTNSTLSAAFDGSLIFIYAIVLLFLNLELAALVIVMASLQVGLLLAGWKSQIYLSANALESQAQSESELVELLAGADTLKATGLDKYAAERWSHTFAEELNARVSSRRHLAVTSALSASIQFVSPVLILLLGLLLLAHHEVTLGDVIGVASLAAGIFVPLASLVQNGLQVTTLRANLVRLDDILRTVPEHGPHALPPPKALDGALELTKVCFAYPGSPANALRDINLTIKPGSFVAIVGRTGCGKSTLATVLAGLRLPTSGQVVLAGKPFVTMDRSALRRSISFLNQDSQLFAGSISENIALGLPGARHEDIIRAARKACVHDDIRALPMEYNTRIGPGGAGLSGGQRQRVALARGLVRCPELLILDEATSALDRETESEIFTNLLESKCTLIVAAHRLTVIQEADLVVVMEAGRITQCGTPAELAAGSTPHQWLTQS